jgi:hypothetical protein
MLPELRPELQFLLLSGQPEEISADRSRSLIHPVFDWDLLFRKAQRNLMIPLVYQRLCSINPEAVPKEVLETFRIPSSKIAARNLILRRELGGILKMFQEESIPVVPFKGPVLTERLYKNVALRHYDDLDVLVHKNDIKKIKDLLLSKGYKPKKDLFGISASQEKAFLRFHCTYDFISRDSAYQLEVHWKLVPETYSLNLNYDSIWKRCTEMSFENLAVLEFCPEDLLLTLCIAGAKKNWDHLLRVCDVSRAILRYPHLDWIQVAQDAIDSRCERILLLGLSLSSGLFESPLPESIVKKIKQSQKVGELWNEIIEKLLRSETESFEMIRPQDQMQPMFIRMRERFSDQARYCARILMTPSVGEWAFITLPGPLYFLYYFLRPTRLVFKAVSRLARLIIQRATRTVRSEEPQTKSLNRTN